MSTPLPQSLDSFEVRVVDVLGDFASGIAAFRYHNLSTGGGQSKFFVWNRRTHTLGTPEAPSSSQDRSWQYQTDSQRPFE